VTLPGDASISNVRAWATPSASDPWHTPVAPTGTTVSVATTWIVDAAWIDLSHDSFVMPANGVFQVKQIFRTTATPVSTIGSFIGLWYGDYHADGSYSTAFWDNFTGSPLFPSATWYGPGMVTTDGLTIPAGTMALYANVYNTGTVPAANRFGPSLVAESLATFTTLDGSGGSDTWWDTSTTTLRNIQRVDDAATTGTPLLPERLP
jgi:hypothetical protein